MYIKFFSFSALVMALLLQNGCTRKPHSDVPLVKLTGKLTLDGKEIEGAMITFLPKDAASTPAPAGTAGQKGPFGASALTGKDGSYKAGTFGSGDGITKGEFKISVSKTSVVGAPVASAAPAKTSSKLTQADLDRVTAENEASERMPKNLVDATITDSIPAKYRSDATSGLVVTIDGDKTFDIALVSK